MSKSISATNLAKMGFCEASVIHKSRMTAKDKERIDRGLRKHAEFEARMTGEAVDIPVSSRHYHDIPFAQQSVAKSKVNTTAAIIKHLVSKTPKEPSTGIYSPTTNAEPYTGKPAPMKTLRAVVAVFVAVSVVSAYSMQLI